MTAGGHKTRYLAGAALIAAAAAFVLLVFALLSGTDITEIWLNPTANADPGWQWEVWEGGQVRPAQAVFRDPYTGCLPAAGADAVRGRLVLPTAYEFAGLRLNACSSGIELFLDGELLYSDFTTDARGAEGFLLLRTEQRAALAALDRRVQIELPPDYAGRTLTLIRYYPAPQPDPLLDCPTLCSDETDYAVMVTSTVPLVLLAGLWALLALVVAAVFVVDLSNGRANWRDLLLMLYFLLLFVHTVDTSLPGGVSLLRRYLGPTPLAALYGAPLLFFLALQPAARLEMPHPVRGHRRLDRL